MNFNNIKAYKKQRAVALPIVLLVFILVSLVLTGMFLLFDDNTFAISRDAAFKEMFYHAKSGIAIAQSSLYAGTPAKPEKIKRALESNPDLVLTDTIDSSKLSDLPDDIKIEISISVQNDSAKKHYGHIKLVSKAINTTDNYERTLTKYIDPLSVNTEYE